MGEKEIIRSRYEEDVYLNNHTSVWGSYWEAGAWGFACCRQLVKVSYCTGAKGIAVRESMLKEMMGGGEAQEGSGVSEEVKSLVEQHKVDRVKWEKERKAKEEKEEKEKEKRFKAALAREEELAKGKGEEEEDERKRKYNSLGKDYKVTDEDMEAFNLKRARADDPMKDFIGKSSKD